MSSKDTIIETTISLINEKGEHLEELTMREISKRAGVGLGLINYHFENKEKLIELCVEKIINEIVDKFRDMESHTKNCTPFEKLDYLGNMTLSFLFEHRAVSKISILSDMYTPQGHDNTQRTLQAYLPLVAACLPGADDKTVYQVTLYLISCMQSVFLRHEVLRQTLGINLENPEERKKFHTKMLKWLINTKGSTYEKSF